MEDRRLGSRTEQFTTENIRKRFIIVIQCDFKGSQNTALDNKNVLLKLLFVLL